MEPSTQPIAYLRGEIGSPFVALQADLISASEAAPLTADLSTRRLGDLFAATNPFTSPSRPSIFCPVSG